jgi:hypothetical protein
MPRPEVGMTTPPRWLQDRIGATKGKVTRFRRELKFAVRDKDVKRAERELKQAQIEHAYAKHWVTLTD